MQGVVGKRGEYSTIALEPDFKRELDEVKNKFYPKLSMTQALKLLMPRCPACGGLLVQKFASSHLVCSKCGREYELNEVSKA